MRIRLLGPIDAVAGDGEVRTIPGLRRKAVLAALALQAGEVVSVSRLVDAVWNGEPPSTSANSLQSHVSFLRRELGLRDAIVARPPGYVLSLKTEATDVQEAERLIALARRTGDPQTTVEYLTSALALWRGRPLADLEVLVWFSDQADRLEGLRRGATQALAEARLALGQHAPLIPQLGELTEEHPYDEELHRQLILALYRDGRQAEALGVYRRLRLRLSEELGIDPQPALRELESAILRQDEALTPPAGPAAAPPPPPMPTREPVPAQLPPSPAVFTGRRTELSQLDGLAARRRAGTGIAVLTGIGGVGKTTLAVAWGQAAAPSFPDGQLFVNLRGYEPEGAAVEPAEALHGLLQALGVPHQRIPAELSARASAYRSLLAGKQVLVVLDNARSAQQVRPLLPGSPGCLVLVTSRDRLTPLVAREGAHTITVESMTGAEAHSFLAGRLGEARVRQEADAVEEIIRRCAGLPLALAVVAAHAVTHPWLGLTELAGQMSGAGGALDVLAGGDEVTDVRQVFSWSYQTLSAPAARAFRLLGALAGPEIGAGAVASLLACGPAEARRLLGELVQAHMLIIDRSGRHTFHDLLRGYAAEKAAELEPPADLAQARLRLLDHYLHSAFAAALELTPQRHPITLPPAAEGVLAERVEGPAVEWFEVERAALVRAVGLAYEGGLDRHAWQLAWAMTPYLTYRGHLADQLACNRPALASAQRLQDVNGQAHALRGLAVADAHLGRFEEARRHFERAIELMEVSADPAERARIRLNFAAVLELNGHPAEAACRAREGLDLYRALGNRGGEAHALNAVGWYCAQLGRLGEATEACETALGLLELLGDRDGIAATSDSLGYIRHQLGRHDQAVDDYRRAVALYREIGDRLNEAGSREHLGDVYASLGELALALEQWRDALVTLTEMQHPDAERVRGKVARTRLARGGSSEQLLIATSAARL